MPSLYKNLFLIVPVVPIVPDISGRSGITGNRLSYPSSILSYWDIWESLGIPGIYPDRV